MDVTIVVASRLINSKRRELYEIKTTTKYYKSHTVAQLVRAVLVNSKVPGASPGGVTDDFSSFYIWLASVEFRREESSAWHVASNFLTL